MDIPDINKLNDAECRAVCIKNRYPEFYEYLQERYPGLLFKEQLYLYSHNLDTVPVCPVCGKKLKIYSFRRGYTEFCSQKCQGKSTDVKERRKRAYFEKTGYDNPMHNPEAREKLLNVVREKYGTDNPFQNEDVKRKIRKTNEERYGVSYPMQCPEIKERSSDTIQEKYGVKWNCMRDEACRLTDNSRPNRSFEKLLQDNGIEFQREFSLENFRYDFKVGDILIEINPTATHNSTRGIRHKDPLPKTYHKEKTDCALRNGYRCVHVWDWDDISKILDMLKSKNTLYARNCELHEVDAKDCNVFCNTNHLQGSCKGMSVAVGLYKDGELVMIMSFGKPRYNRKYQYELLRMCTLSRCVVVGGAERLFKYFVDKYKPKNVISYCDRSKFTGDVYQRLGFTTSDKVSPSGHWYNERTHQHVTDNLLRQRGYDQLFGTHYGKGTSNEYLMVQTGWDCVYDCGQSVYTYDLV